MWSPGDVKKRKENNNNTLGAKYNNSVISSYLTHVLSSHLVSRKFEKDNKDTYELFL